MVHLPLFVYEIQAKVSNLRIPTIEDLAYMVYNKIFPIPTEDQVIYTNNPKENAKSKNVVITAKYNIFTFIPKNLIEQFQRVANIYFLIISLLQLTTGLSPTGRFGTAVPLVLVMIAQMAKDIYEDIFRRRTDSRTNNAKTLAYRDGELKMIKWKQVKVGDILKIQNNEYFPADMMCIACQSKKLDDDGNKRKDICYIETAQLDGETNLKTRKPHIAFKEMAEETIKNVKAKVKCEAPNAAIYKFNGNITVDKQIEVPVSTDHMLLRGSKLMNTEWALGIVVYCGRHTKLRMNARKSPHKRSKIEKLTNYYLFSLFITQWIITILCVILLAVWNATSKQHWYIFHKYTANAALEVFKSVITFFILFNNFIPISLYVSIEFVKLLQANIFMNNDIGMYFEEKDSPAEVKSSSLNEELGQVEYIFSDKTGTLTQNKMELLKFAIKDKMYGFFQGDASPYNNRPPNWKVQDGFQFYDSRINEGAFNQESYREEIEDFLSILALCHDVIPEKQRDVTPAKIIYTSPSPDENALVKAAQYLGFELVDKTSDKMTVRINNKNHVFKLLNILEFNSTRKRMSTIVEYPNGKIFILTKGADSVMKPLLSQGNGDWNLAERQLDTMAKEGLRTLVVAKAELNRHVYDHWNKNFFIPAASQIKDRKKKLAAAAEIIEKNLQLVGVTAIEDKLQDHVPDSIAQLAVAGIKIWVLTGDKLETAINIGKTCRMLTDDMIVMQLNYTDAMSEGKTPAQQRREIRQLIETYSNMAQNQYKDRKLGIVVTGHTLSLIMEDGVMPKKLTDEMDDEEKAYHSNPQNWHWIVKGEEKLEIAFLRLAMQCQSVICCRVTPLQKSQVVLLVKNNLLGTPITLAIGDGANDVSMIQAAHIGVGISGEEGLQAAKAADYAIAQFHFLRRLLLVHGRYNYRRIAKLIVYSFYKNAIVQLCNFYYIFFNGYTGTSLYENTSLALFNVVFASLPIVILALFDMDVKPETSLHFPQLYYDGPSDYHFNIVVFLQWILNAVWQSLIIFFVPYFAFQSGLLLNGQTPDQDILGFLIYSCIIIVVNFKILIESSSWTIFHILSVAFSILIWFIFVLVYSVLWWIVPKINFFPFDEVEISTRAMYFLLMDAFSSGLFWMLLIIVVIASLGRDVIWKSFKRTFIPRFYHTLQDMEGTKNFPHGYSQNDLASMRMGKIKVRTRDIKPQPRVKPTLTFDELSSQQFIHLKPTIGTETDSPGGEDDMEEERQKKRSPSLLLTPTSPLAGAPSSSINI